MKRIQNVNDTIISQKKSTKKIPTVIAIICCLAVFTLVVILLKEKLPKLYNVDAGNTEKIMEDVSEGVEEGYFETYMNTEWTFPSCTSESTDALFGNSVNNKKPIQCIVTLDDTGEEVYTSGVLQVGEKLSSIKLSKDIDKGTYPATCKVKLLDKQPDGKYKEYSSAGFAVNIIVQK